VVFAYSKEFWEKNQYGSKDWMVLLLLGGYVDIASDVAYEEVG
jgi:hypothetical protein